jgi:flagellar hook-basal body complex protein FliE
MPPPSDPKEKSFVDFLDRMMHQIVNNQQVVVGRLELALHGEEAQDQKLRDEISHAMEAAERNNKLIAQIKKRLLAEKDGSSRR